MQIVHVTCLCAPRLSQMTSSHYTVGSGGLTGMALEHIAQVAVAIDTNCKFVGGAKSHRFAIDTNSIMCDHLLFHCPPNID